MSKYKLEKFVKFIDNETAKEFYQKHKDEIDNLVRRRDSKFGGINSAGRILSKDTYAWWSKFLVESKLSGDLLDYRKFHEWVINLHGYGEDGMFLSCIHETEANEKTIFFLPKKLSLTIRPKNLNQKGVIYKYTGWLAKINDKSYGMYETREEAQAAARKAMVARIHSIMEECKDMISAEAYRAILEI